MTTQEVTPAGNPAGLPMRPAVVYRPDSAVYWVLLVSLVIGIGVTASLLGSAFRETFTAELWLAPIWIVAVVVLVWVIFKFDPFRATRPYKQALFTGTALGGTLAMALTLSASDEVEAIWSAIFPPDVMATWSSALRAPLTEEASKAVCAAIILVLCASVFHRISHALIVGMFVGLGFDLVEDLNYAGYAAISNLDGDTVGAYEMLMQRFETSLPAHWSYTGLTAVGVLLLLPTFSNPANWSKARRMGVAAALFATAWFIHFWFDSPPISFDALGAIVFLLKVPVSLAIFLVVTVLLIRDERRWVNGAIAHGRESGALADIDPAVLDSLPTYRLRRKLRKGARREGGRPEAKRIKVEQARALDLIQATG